MLTPAFGGILGCSSLLLLMLELSVYPAPGEELPTDT